MGNENSTTSKALGQPARVPSIEPHHAPRKLGRKPSTKPNMVDHGLHSDQQHGKQPLVNDDDDDDTFSNYIQRAKHKLIRSLTNIGPRKGDISNAESDVANAPVGNNTKDDHNDHFTNFIQHTRKKLRTLSRVGKNNGSFKRG